MCIPIIKGTSRDLTKVLIRGFGSILIFPKLPNIKESHRGIEKGPIKLVMTVCSNAMATFALQVLANVTPMLRVVGTTQSTPRPSAMPSGYSGRLNITKAKRGVKKQILTIPNSRGYHCFKLSATSPIFKKRPSMWKILK